MMIVISFFFLDILCIKLLFIICNKKCKRNFVSYLCFMYFGYVFLSIDYDILFGNKINMMLIFILFILLIMFYGD